MKRFFEIILAIILIVSMSACTSEDQTTSPVVNSDNVVYAGGFAVTKMDAYDVSSSVMYGYVMSIKNDGVSLLIQIPAEVYLKYEVEDAVIGEVKNVAGKYYFQSEDFEDAYPVLAHSGLEN